MPDRECWLCGVTDNIHKHHLDWHHNNNTPNNIMYLCQPHHVEIHRCGWVDMEFMRELRRKLRGEAETPDLDARIQKFDFSDILEE